MDDATTGFVLLRPLWLVAIPPLLLLVGLTARRLGDAGWHRCITPDRLAHLRVARSPATLRRSVVIGAALTLGCVALAGPSWRAEPTAGARDRQAMVLLLDLSPSMLARDVVPDRLSRARLKLVDLLRTREDGDSALIVYADDAFRVAPLTDDPGVIEALVPALHPDIMPRSGSRPEAAVELALTLFDGAGREHGDIVAITDGMHPDAIATIERLLPPGFRLSILGVGTADGTPIPTSDGAYLRDADDRTVLAALDGAPLAALAARTGGRYSPLTIDDGDIEHLLALAGRPLDPRLSLDGTTADTRHDAGYWLVLALLPLLAWGFRRNALWMTVPVLLLLPPDGHAFDWRDLWLTADQRGARALARGNADEAAGHFEDRRWKAVALHRAGDPAEAAELLADAVTADDHYNLGNALALSGDLAAALRAYDHALERYIGNDARADDARFNRDEVQALLDALEREAEAEGGAAPPSRGGDDDDGDTDGEDDESSEEETGGQAAATRQENVGGAAGAGAGTLDQRALGGDGRAASIRGEPADVPDGDVPDDATKTASPETLAAADEPTDGREADSTRPPVEDNDNRVLTPYGERWLRTLPRDPGGYLRHKFRYLAETRSRDDETGATATPAPGRH
mgnify:CR=1 FL=1